MFRNTLYAVFVMVFLGPAVQASSILAFHSVEPGDTKSWTLSCSNCNMLAFLDNDGKAYDSSGLFSVAGTLGTTGSAFTPITGKPANRNPDLAGDDKEEAFLKAIALVQGDSVSSTSFQKTGSTSNPNTGPGAATDAGDYFLWKASTYAGVAKILSVGQGNIFTFAGSHGLSHIAHISTQLVPQPLPSGLPLLLGGLGVIAVIRRRARS